MKTKICRGCGIVFKVTIGYMRYCTDGCKKFHKRTLCKDTPEDRNRRANDNWLNKKPDTPEKQKQRRQYQSKIAYAATQEDKVNKRYQACRG